METTILDFEMEMRERQTAPPIRIGTSRVDLQNGAAQNPNGEHRLRRKELQLLTFLHQHAGAVFSRDELLRRVWNYEGVLTTRTVDQTVSTLRRKLNDNTDQPRYLITIYGIGYQLRTELEPN
jgi:two-component system alkaline phosphatase synthesis response regulator PhoP/two-component system response regulator VicR